ARLRCARRRARQGGDHPPAQRADRRRPRRDAALDQRRGAHGAARAGAHHVGEAADGTGPRASPRHRRRRSPALRRHAFEAHRRDRPRRGHQDREQGQAEPPRRHRLRRLTARKGGEKTAMPYANPDALVSTEWLAAHLDAPDLRIVDGTFTLPGVTPTGHQLYLERHIPGAVFFDIDDIADERNPLPHMLPSPEQFSTQMRKLGLGDGHKIVVYDSAGLSSAGRPWWMLRVFGHQDVAILDGGLPKWQAEGRP